MQKIFKAGLTAALTVALTAFTVTHGMAHQEKPRHGGVMSEAKELNFELVSENGKAALYVLDHGAMVPTANASGRLLILNDKVKTEAALTPAGDNKLLSTTDVLLQAGTKAIATVKLADGQSVSVRFAF